MVDFISLWIIVGTLGFSLAAPLGPVNTEMIKKVLDKTIPERVAWLAAILTGIGAMTADFIIAFSALTIGGEIFNAIFSSSIIRFGLFSANILILGWLGISALISKPPALPGEGNFTETEKLTTYAKKLLQQYITGFSMVVTSPWSYLWWVSAGTILLFGEFNAPDLGTRLMIVIMFLSGIFIWIIIFTSTLKFVGRLPNPRIFLWITRGTAIILLFFASLMVGEAWNALIEILNL